MITKRMKSKYHFSVSPYWVQMHYYFKQDLGLTELLNFKRARVLYWFSIVVLRFLLLNSRDIHHFVVFYCFFQQEIKAMNPDAILARQVEQLDKEKKELQSKLKAQEKKVKMCKLMNNKQFSTCVYTKLK